MPQPTYLEKLLLIALIPACARAREFTVVSMRYVSLEVVQSTLRDLQAAGMVAVIMLTERDPVWTLTPAGRKKARSLRDGTGEDGPAPRIEEQPKLL